MSWLWIYITLMEWVGIVLVVKALGDEQYHIEPKKAGVYFLGNMLYYAAFMYFGLPQICSVIGYVLLYAYIYWCYHDGIVKTLAMCVMGLIILGVVELLLSQGVYYLFGRWLVRGNIIYAVSGCKRTLVKTKNL